jgi:hypothetical protein
VRLSEFWYAVGAEFGESYGRVVTADLVVSALGDRTAVAALRAGIPARTVWLALCDACDVPPERRIGVGLPEPSQTSAAATEATGANWPE